jgi:SAM-dependent methyltransferase
VSGGITGGHDDGAARRRAHDHEKHYMTRAGTERWERVKPFSTPGHDDVAEAAHLMHDFAAALALLAPKPGQRVLDLGAGSCWVSEWLQRLNVDTVSVDLSESLLRVGSARLRPGSAVVAGDLEELPLADASCDLAICMNALHHVPDRGRALHSVWRVLKAGGRVLFSEPGAGHSEAESSRTAVEAFGVREEDVPPAVLLAACERAGFCDVRLVPFAHVVPHYGVGASDWSRWERLTRQRRPRRALRKMLRAVAELLGVAKGGPMFEEAIGMQLVRLVHAASSHHPIVVARRPA